MPKRRAHAPSWWWRMADSLPKFSIPALEPKVWNPDLALRWVRAIPSKCPFERQLWWRDRLLLYVPPLCSLNPLSGQLYSIRVAAQTYLAALPADFVKKV